MNKNQDLAPDAVTSDKIKNGEVKAEDLDPSIELGGGAGSTPGFSLQVTERSNSITSPDADPAVHLTVSVQCNSDEIVTGGGFSLGPRGDTSNVLESKKQDNGWTTTWKIVDRNEPLDVYAECLKVVNEGTTG